MKTEKTINICGHDVKMRYCAAAESGYEQLAGKTIAVFIPTFGKNEQGEDVITKPAEATTYDFLALASAAIAAAYANDNQEPPVTTEDILYEASPQEVTTLLNTVIELRNEWYGIPKVVQEADKAEAPKTENEEERPKN